MKLENYGYKKSFKSQKNDTCRNAYRRSENAF